MKNFNFYNPTKIIFGKGEISSLKHEITPKSKVLMLYGGGSIKKNGIYKEVIEALEGIDFIEFGGIPPNPEYSVLLNALEIIKTKKINFLLAVGGGSVIDATKFLSSAALYKGKEPWEILQKKIRTEVGMPFGTVLTLPATGSEMNSGAVISRKETKEKYGMGGPGLFPKFSILDPKVVYSIPKKQIANGLADSFTHVLEQYMTYPVGAFLQDRFAESILTNIIEIAPLILNNTKNYNLASEFMWSCTMALNGLIQKGVPNDWAIHAIGHELTALYGIDHARTLAIITKSHYEYNIKSKQEKLIQFGKRVLQKNISAREVIDEIDKFYHSLEIPTKLSNYISNYEGTAEIIKNRFEERQWNSIGEKGSLSPSDIEKIVKMSYK